MSTGTKIVMRLVFWTMVAIAIVVYVILNYGLDAITEPLSIFAREVVK